MKGKKENKQERGKEDFPESDKVPSGRKVTKVIAKIEGLRKELSQIYRLLEKDRNIETSSERLTRWKDRTVRYLRENVSEKEASNLDGILLYSYGISNLRDEISQLEGALIALLEEIENHPDYVFESPSSDSRVRLEAQREEILQKGVISPNNSDPILLVEQICSRFPLFVRQLGTGHATRTSFSVQDESDVQDLLHALLRLFFDDIRTEECTPSYAGKCSRMDFLIKDQSIVIETKKTRAGLEAKEVGTQLLDDILRYQEHPSCKTLFCFVYDPETRIANPRGIENDLSRKQGSLIVKVLIAPKGY